MIHRHTVLFAALSGTDDCPLSRLRALEHTLAARRRFVEATQVSQLCDRYTAAESALSQAAEDGVPARVRQAAVADHRATLTTIHATLAQFEDTPA